MEMPHEHMKFFQSHCSQKFSQQNKKKITPYE